jgi:UDP-glucose 4-epimerase
MRIVVVGATGNVGTSLVRALSADPAVESVLGLARRLPELTVPKALFSRADIRHTDLAPLFDGADAVVHLAWAIQPSHRPDVLRSVNVDGSDRVFRAVAAAGVPSLVYASSVGAYSPGPKDRRVDESWPTDGVATSFYSRHKVLVERMLDRFERDCRGVRVVRLRPALIFKREAASGIRRLFAGPLLPSPLVHPALLPVVPDTERLRFQAVHTDDVASAYRLAVRSDASGPFNVAAEPVLDGPELGRILDSRSLRVPPGVLRAAADLSWRAHLQPTPPGWVDLALGVPLLDAGRAARVLGWEPKRSAAEALRELLDGLRDRAGDETPPLAPDTGGPLRLRELVTGIGRRSGVRSGAAR